MDTQTKQHPGRGFWGDSDRHAAFGRVGGLMRGINRLDISEEDKQAKKQELVKQLSKNNN